MKVLVEGYADDRVQFCPYCSARIGSLDCENKYTCEDCGAEFYVIG